MEDINLIIYKWDQGVYSLEDLVILTKFNNITSDQFHQITGYNYEAVAQQMKNSD